nr:MAG TPA: hypothetical protein [Bacteriophage sp.]
MEKGLLILIIILNSCITIIAFLRLLANYCILS